METTTLKNSIDLLPFSYRRNRLIRKRCLQWITVLIVVLLGVSFEYQRERQDYQSDLRHLRAQKSKYAGVVSKKKELAQLEKQISASSESAAMEFDSPLNNIALNLLGIVSNSVRGCNGRLWVEELKMVCDVTTENTNCRVGISGKALDNLVVATFAAALRESAVFQRVAVKRTNNGSTDNQMRNYSLECVHW